MQVRSFAHSFWDFKQQAVNECVMLTAMVLSERMAGATDATVRTSALCRDFTSFSGQTYGYNILSQSVSVLALPSYEMCKQSAHSFSHLLRVLKHLQ
jgi:hypothetical protein